MSTIDLKLKSYDELIFEITTLTTNNYFLQQKVEQLENIRKEAIKYVQEKADYPISYYHCLNDLLNILNKGSNKE